MKKRIISFLSCAAAAAVLMSSTVYAHNKDVNSGGYTNNQQKNLMFRITQSAQTSLMNKDVYESALKWNKISSNVNISIIMEVPGMPTIPNAMYVYGSKGENIDDPHVLGVDDYGLTNYFDSEHNMVYNYNNNISYVRISINIAHPVYNTLKKPSEAAAMNFTHEVGHTLMLAHPTKGATGHVYWNNLPYAVMNQGFPETDKEVSPVPTEHDKQCLLYKWGA